MSRNSVGDPSPLTPPKVIVIGGGLAGMTVARELARRGVPVQILESSKRMGGKAGSEPRSGFHLDHGYHVFPGWYLNTRKLLEELNVLDRLIDIDRVHYVKPGKFPARHTLYAMTEPRNLWRNLWSGLVPWYDAILASYFALDLASASFDQRSYLDRVSASGYLRSRLYATEGVAAAHHHFVLQASSIPNYEISAMTAKRITSSWFKIPNPIFSILDGDLQHRFIEPFEQDLVARGVDLQLERNVSGMTVEDTRISALRIEGRAAPIEIGPDDLVVITTPHKTTHAYVDDAVYRAEIAAPENEDEKLLSDLVHLRSAPMASFHIFLNRKVTDIPREHTVLADSIYEISFVDISQHWSGFDTTVLSCIASEFSPLVGCSEPVMKELLVGEVLTWMNGIVKASDVDWGRTIVFPNVAAPLFLNTVGAWTYRPATKTRLENLYIAGDYCRSRVDLTTMEGAISSGISTAAEIARRLSLKDPPEVIEIPEWPRWLMRGVALAFLPLALGLKAGLWVREKVVGAG